MHPPCPIWVEKDLIVVPALQHRRNAERIYRPRWFVHPFNQVVNALDTGYGGCRLLEEPGRLNGSKERD
jgi:hypothetical protein